MTTTSTTTSLTLTILRLAAAVLVVAPAAARAEPAPPLATPATASRLEDVTTEQRVRLMVDLVPGASGHAAASEFAAGGRMSREVLVYRFRVVAIDSAGDLTAEGAAWSATVLVGNPEQGVPLRPLVFLGSATRELTLPRPLGYRLDAGDSIVAVASVDPSAARAPRRLLVAIDYERIEGGASRLAVTPLPAIDGSVGAGVGRDTPSAGERAPRDGEAEWSWTPDRDGRLLAIAGLPLEQVRALALEDVGTGEQLWSTTVRDVDGRVAFGKRGDVVRMGAALQSGRTYRLRATLLAASETGVKASGPLVAMVLPSRAAR